MKKSLLLSWIEFLPAFMILPLILVLPRRLGLLLARFVGLVAWLLVVTYRKVAKINLDLVFNGALEKAQCKALIRQSFINFALTAYELILTSRLSKEQIIRLTSCPDREMFLQTIKDGKGIIVCSAHYSNWYWPAFYCAAQGGKVNVVVRPLDNPLLDRQMNRALKRKGISVIPRAHALEEGRKAFVIRWDAPAEPAGPYTGQATRASRPSQRAKPLFRGDFQVPAPSHLSPGGPVQSHRGRCATHASRARSSRSRPVNSRSTPRACGGSSRRRTAASRSQVASNGSQARHR